MKFKLTLIIGIFLLSNIYSQQKFLIGKWKTNKSNKFQTITHTEFTENKLFKLNSTLNNESSVFSFLENKTGNSFTNAEGGAVMVDTKGLYVAQPDPNNDLTGIWEVLDDHRLTTYTIDWSYQPRASTSLIIGKFDEETEFVIDFTKGDNCNDIGYVIKVDNETVKTVGNRTQTFLTETSFYGKGKLIVIQKITGSCNKFGRTTGQLRIYRK
jgi:hypothetical protein